MIWRRSYDTPPPPIEPGSEWDVAADPRYADLPPEVRARHRVPGRRARAHAPVVGRRRRARPAGGQGRARGRPRQQPPGPGQAPRGHLRGRHRGPQHRHRRAPGLRPRRRPCGPPAPAATWATPTSWPGGPPRWPTRGGDHGPAAGRRPGGRPLGWAPTRRWPGRSSAGSSIPTHGAPGSLVGRGVPLMGRTSPTPVTHVRPAGVRRPSCPGRPGRVHLHRGLGWRRPGGGRRGGGGVGQLAVVGRLRRPGPRRPRPAHRARLGQRRPDGPVLLRRGPRDQARAGGR